MKDALQKIDIFNTQKANGLVALTRWYKQTKLRLKRMKEAAIQVPDYYVITSSDFTLQSHWQKDLDKQGLFARPAPTNPAHGFLDSVRVTNLEEISALYKRVKDVDSGGELILMRDFTSATSNMIITPNAISTGPGNDGATEGKDALLLGYTSHPGSWFNLSLESGVSDAHHPYLEVVQHRFFPPHQNSFEQDVLPHDSKSASRVVQCRAGELVEGPAKSYVPNDIVPKRVIIPNGTESFIEWRKLVMSLDPKDDVVYHQGGGLHCHWGVNTKEAGITYISQSTTPIVAGKEIKSSDFSAPKFVFNHREFSNGFSYALRSFVVPDPGEKGKDWKFFHEHATTYREAMAIMLFAFHNHQHQYPREGSRLLGLGIGYACRLLGLLCIGEYRYAPSKPVPPGNSSKAGARADVWEKWWSIWGSAAQREVELSYKSFEDEDWGSSYGGAKWQRIARYQILLFELSQHICRLSYSTGTWSSDSKFAFSYDTLNTLHTFVIDTFNEVINVGHNCGWVFNKFVHQNLFDHAADQSLQFALFAGPALEQHRSFIKHGWEDPNPGSYDVNSVAGLQVAEAFKKSRVTHKTFVPYALTLPGDKAKTVGLVNIDDLFHGGKHPDCTSDMLVEIFSVQAQSDIKDANSWLEKDTKAIVSTGIELSYVDDEDDADSLPVHDVEEEPASPALPFAYIPNNINDFETASSGKTHSNAALFTQYCIRHGKIKPLFFTIRPDNVVHIQSPKLTASAMDKNKYNTSDVSFSQLCWSTEIRNYESLLHKYLANDGSLDSLHAWWDSYKYPHCNAIDAGTPGPLASMFKEEDSPKWYKLQRALPGITVTTSMAMTDTPYIMVQPVMRLASNIIDFYPMIPDYAAATPRFKLTAVHGLFGVAAEALPLHVINKVMTVEEVVSNPALIMDPCLGNLKEYPVFKDALPYADFKTGHHKWWPNFDNVWGLHSIVPHLKDNL